MLSHVWALQGKERNCIRVALMRKAGEKRCIDGNRAGEDTYSAAKARTGIELIGSGPVMKREAMAMALNRAEMLSDGEAERRNAE